MDAEKHRIDLKTVASSEASLQTNEDLRGMGIGRLAFIFPGQGSQFAGMGEKIYERFETARKIYDEASDHLGMDIKGISFEGPEDKLRQTKYAQPAIFVYSMALSALLLEREILPAIVAGHSLGEYSALVQAGVLGLSDGLRVVGLRGELMQRAGEKNPGKMAAIIGLSEREVVRICRGADSEGRVVPANFNSRDQIVISGTPAAVKKAMELAREAGAKRVVELRVNGAFHSSLMEEISHEFERALWAVPMNRANIPVVVNVSADVVTEAGQIRELLVRQLVSPVKWVQSMEKMVELGVTEMVETGPGNVLRGLMRKINSSIKVMNAEDLIFSNC